MSGIARSIPDSPNLGRKATAEPLYQWAVMRLGPKGVGTPMKGYGNPLLVRAAAAVPEQRRELGLSVSQLARLARVSRSTISKIERGGHVPPEVLLRIATALMTLELYQGPREPAEGMVDDLAPLPLFSWPPVSLAGAPTLGYEA